MPRYFHFRIRANIHAAHIDRRNNSVDPIANSGSDSNPDSHAVACPINFTGAGNHGYFDNDIVRTRRDGLNITGGNIDDDIDHGIGDSRIHGSTGRL